MGKLALRKFVKQRTVDKLFSVFYLAKECGYRPHIAKALALGAVDRAMNGGFHDFAKKIRAIKRGTAKAGKQDWNDFDRLVQGRIWKPVDLTLNESDSYWIYCECDVHTADMSP